MAKAEYTQPCALGGVAQETVTLTCNDGRVLFWETYGWSFSNTSYKAHLADNKVAPASAVRDCMHGKLTTY